MHHHGWKCELRGGLGVASLERANASRLTKPAVVCDLDKQSGRAASRDHPLSRPETGSTHGSVFTVPAAPRSKRVALRAPLCAAGEARGRPARSVRPCGFASRYDDRSFTDRERSATAASASEEANWRRHITNKTAAVETISTYPLTNQPRYASAKKSPLARD